MQAESTITAPGRGICRVNATFIPIFHVGAAAILFFWSWQWAASAVLLYWLAGSLGIGIGYHRLLTHHGFRTLKPVEYFLTVCGMLALHDGLSNWVATNRIHHPRTVVPGVDPHTQREGRWRSHAGRILRVTLALHATWLVNSATHLWGSRRFATDNDSRNNWWVAMQMFGEGWHNNHHAHPVPARHGLAWYEVNVNWWGTCALRLLGLAKDVQVVDDAGRAKEAVSTRARP